MTISVLFTPAGRLMSLHICAGMVTGQWRVYTFAHVPRSTSYGVYISQLIRFARASSYVADFNTGNKLLTQKLLKVTAHSNNRNSKSTREVILGSVRL